MLPSCLFPPRLTHRKPVVVTHPNQLLLTWRWIQCHSSLQMHRPCNATSHIYLLPSFGILVSALVIVCNMSGCWRGMRKRGMRGALATHESKAAWLGIKLSCATLALSHEAMVRGYMAGVLNWMLAGGDACMR